MFNRKRDYFISFSYQLNDKLHIGNTVKNISEDKFCEDHLYIYDIQDSLTEQFGYEELKIISFQVLC